MVTKTIRAFTLHYRLIVIPLIMSKIRFINQHFFTRRIKQIVCGKIDKNSKMTIEIQTKMYGVDKIP